MAYCRSNPEAVESITRAGIKLEATERKLIGWDGAMFTGLQKPHRFSSGAPWGKCSRCGKTREELSVLHKDDLHHEECEKWQEPADIIEVIRVECEKFQKLLERARNLIDRNKEYSAGEMLKLWQTHGISPDVIEMIQGRVLGCAVLDEFRKGMEEAADRSRERAKPRDILVAK